MQCVSKQTNTVYEWTVKCSELVKSNIVCLSTIKYIVSVNIQTHCILKCQMFWLFCVKNSENVGNKLTNAEYRITKIV